MLSRDTTADTAQMTMAMLIEMTVAALKDAAEMILPVAAMKSRRSPNYDAYC